MKEIIKYEMNTFEDIKHIDEYGNNVSERFPEVGKTLKMPNGAKKKIIEKDVDKLVYSVDLLINNTVAKINCELINLYWSIGKLVNDYRKENNSSYRDSVYTMFSNKLSIKYGKGFTRRNINNMCLFNRLFENWHLGANFKNVSWSHIRELLKFKNIVIINFYLNEVENKKLTKDELISFIKCKSYERAIINQRKKIKNDIEKTLKDPIILNIDNKKRSERELEKEILNNISNFKREIGDYVMFFESQYKININGLVHKVDLVFFDNNINSYILVDLKINKVTNRDIFQMQMYTDYFNKYMKKNSFNKTIGIILCETKDARVEIKDGIYQVKYLNEIPKEQELLKIINDNKIILLKTENLQLNI